MGINSILQNLCNNKLGADFEQRVESELLKILENANDEESIIEEVIENYRILIELLTKKRQPKNIKLAPDDLANIVIDDVAYDLDTIFSHDDLCATECRCVIDSLLADWDDVTGVLQKVEEALNEK